MRIRFLAPARREFKEAVDYYDSQEAGLGDEFADEVWETISRIASHPSAWQQLSKDQTLPYKEVPLRSNLPHRPKANSYCSGNAFAPEPG